MLNIVKKVLDTAKSQVGYVEGKNNWNIYAEYFDHKGWQFFNTHKQNTAYCSVGLHWCLIQHMTAANVRKILGEPAPKNNCGAGVKYLYNYLKDNAKAEHILAPGAFIFFKTKVDGKEIKFGHVEIVTSVDTKIHTIGFNKSGKVNVKECSYPKNSTKISGYLMPLYSKVEIKEDKPKNDKPAEVIKSAVPAASFNKIFNKTYHTTKEIPLTNRRTPNQTIATIPAGAAVRCYGFFTSSFLYVTYEGKEGYVNVNYLR